MRVLITDMDGTVVDSMEFLRELAIALVVADHHSETKIRALYDETFGKPIVAQYEEWNRRYPQSRVDVPRLVRMYESVHRLAAPNFPVTDFYRSLMTFQHALHMDWQFALVTSTNKSIMLQMPQLRSTQWSAVDGYDGSTHTKRRQILECVERLGCQLDNVVYVGDAPSDKELADDLGIAYYYPSGTLVQTLLGRRVFTGAT